MDKKKLLIVDNDIMVRQLILSVASNMDFEVEEANDGMEGIEFIKKGINFDVVIADMRMQSIGDFEFLKALKGCSPSPVAILMTAYGLVVIANESTSSDTFECLTKSSDRRLSKKLDAVICHKQLINECQEEIVKTPKVLVVDHDESYRNQVEIIVKEAGYNAVTASNGMEGFRLFKQGYFEIVISDVKMPEMDGVTLLSNIKEIDPDTVIILLADSPDVNMAVQAIKRGAYDFISKPFDPENLKTAIRNAWERKYRIHQEKLLIQLYEGIKKDAITDTLTGLRNGYYANMKLEEELNRVKNGDYCNFAVVIGDIDNFKIINDAIGLHAGDVVLRLIGHTIKDTIRQTDVASRYGGDEFLLILSGTDCCGAEGMVKKILKKITELNQQIHPKLKDLPVEISLSFGISCSRCAGTDAVELLKKADYALYECKIWRDEQYITYERLLHEKPYKDSVIDMSEAFEKEINNRIAYSLANIIDHKDMMTRNHSKLVSRLSVKLGKYLSLAEETLYRIQIGGMLHDIGKLGVSLEILGKKDKLTEDEIAVMKKHVEMGMKIVSNIHNFDQIVPIIAAIHERWDGKGYPQGLKGEEIPIESRIIAVVDAYLAMRIDRAYRKSIADNVVIEELVKNSGRQFDPKIVDTFLQIQRQR
jgi:diguanylate cyclase (GGDEF)-like protein